MLWFADVTYFRHKLFRFLVSVGWPSSTSFSTGQSQRRPHCYATMSCEDPRKAFGKASQRTCWMLLHCYTLAGVLWVCRSCLRDVWDALPLANHESHETAWTERNRQVLHKAESVTVLSQQCRSYRYAAEILDL